MQCRDFVDHTSCDPALSKLLLAIESNFPSVVSNSHLIQPYLPFCEGYYIFDGIIMYRDCVIVPVSLRGIVLKALDADHQGVSVMERRARTTVFWPGIIQDINNIHNSCVHCNRNAPSQSAIPPMPTKPPTTPFKHILADYFDNGGRHFLVIRDKFSGWADVFGTSLGSNIAGAVALVRLLRTYFATFGVPDEISTDGGPEFTAFASQQFLKTWGVEHRVSSAYFPQSDGRAEVAVKAAKRLLIDNVSPRGNLNNDLFLRALLQLRNTPDADCGMSPAETVFGHPLQNAFLFVNRSPKFTNRSIRRTWREAWRAKEDTLRLRAGRINTTLRTSSCPLRALHCGDSVFL